VPVKAVIPVMPSSDLAQDVALWQGLLGVAPTFVDGDRWAQFDVGAGRLALAGRDRVSVVRGFMLMVVDLEAARADAEALGLQVGLIEVGPHERRCVALGGHGAPIVLYAPL
jgi:hypothetical protein